MATADDALLCCNQTKDLMSQLTAGLASLQDELNGLQTALDALQNRVTAIEAILKPVINQTVGPSELEDWLRLELLTSENVEKDIVLGFADGIAKADPSVATKVVNALDSELMDWVLSKLIDALDFMPAGISMTNTTGARDPSGGAIIVEMDSGQVKINAQADLEAQTDAGAGLWEFTYTIASLVADTVFNILSKAINKNIPDKSETDPQWDRDKARNFATAIPEEHFTAEEISDVVSASKAAPIRQTIIATTNAQGAPYMLNVPDGWTPIKVNPIDPNNPLITNFGPIIDSPSPPIEKTVDSNGNVVYTNVFPGMNSLVAFTDEKGVVHSTNLVPGSTPFDTVTDPAGNTVITNFDQNSVPFTTATDTEGNLIIEPR